MAPQDDLTAERAAAEDVYYGLQVMNTPDYNLREADMKRDIQAIITLIRQTRQEALREAAKVCSEWHKIDRSNINSVAEMAEVLALKLDQLASEGG